jgi:CHAT domain-containing protein
VGETIIAALNSDAIKSEQEVLGAFYQHLLAPVEAHLEGATEVLIIPHKELFEVPWAALFHIQTGQYLIQRVAPSLRVARTAADALRGINGYSLGPPPRRVNGRMFVSQPTYVEKPKYMSVGRLFHSQRKYQSDETHVASTQVGHALVVGNLLRGVPLPKAEVEAEFVAELLSGVGFEVHALMGQAATKEDVQSKIEGAKWEVEEEEEEEKTSSSGKKHTAKRKKGRIKKTLKLGAGKRRAAEEEEEEEESSEADLTMDEVQGSVRMGVGSTVVLSACNSGRGNIRAEGVMGLSRGFLFAGAAATVVSLWAVHDGSTAALMKQMYKHLEDGRTTAQALRLAMLHLLNGPAESGRDSRWRRPLYWAAFLVVGANTRLPGV